MQAVEVDGQTHAYYHTGRYDLATDTFQGGELAAMVNAKRGPLFVQVIAKGKTEAELIESIRHVKE